MKFKMKKDGLTGDALKFAEAMEASLTEAFEGVKDGADEKAVNDLINKALEGKGLTAEQEKTISDTAESVRKQAAEIQKLKDSGIGQEPESFMKTLEADKEELIRVHKAGTGVRSYVIKAPAVTTTATSGATRAITNSVDATGAQRLGDGMFNEIRRLQPFILDYVNVGNTNASVLVWWDEKPKEGDFAITAEGAVKPMVQYRFERVNANYQKAAGYTVITDEFDRDFPNLVTIIKRLMQTDVRNKISALIYTDFLAAATTYSYTGLNLLVDNADNYAAIGAAVVQAKTFGFNPNVLFLNPADEMVMNFQKDSTGQYVGNPFGSNTNYTFDAVISDPSIAAGTFIVGDMTNFNVDFYGDVIVKIGYVNDDLIRNQFTVVVERFFFDYISANKKPGIVKGTFATIKTAIEKP